MTNGTKKKPPSHYVPTAARIGPLCPERYTKNPAPWPMYSFERPALILWHALAAELFANGWTDDAIREWLQSKAPRWELDGELGDHLSALGKLYARKIITDAQK